MIRSSQREAQASSQVKYPQCRSVVYAPTHELEKSTKRLWEQANEKPPPVAAPDTKLELDFVYGYHNSGYMQTQRSNIFYLRTKEIVYPSAALVILYNQETHTQNFFRGHSEEVSCIAVHPNGRFVASSQTGRFPPIFVWDSKKRIKGTKQVSDESHLATLDGHERTTCSLSFSHDGKLLVSVGSDDHNTAIVWDWKHHTSLAQCSAGGQPVFDMRFNPYQAYGIPDNPPLPGQAPSEDDAVYTLTSCGVRHIKFWVFLRSQDEDSDLPDAKRWYLEGNNVNYATKTSVQDITCFTFVDDSKPLTIRNERGHLESIGGSTERTDSRVVAGTSDGDVFVFKQPEVKLRYGNSSKEPQPWWILDGDTKSSSDSHNVSKRMLWDSFATLIGIIPHNVSAGNRYILPRKDRDEIDRLTAKLRLQSHNTELKKKLEAMYYSGPIAHQGATSMVEFNKSSGVLVTSGKDGKIRVWDPNIGIEEQVSASRSGKC